MWCCEGSSNYDNNRNNNLRLRKKIVGIESGGVEVVVEWRGEKREVSVVENM